MAGEEAFALEAQMAGEEAFALEATIRTGPDSSCEIVFGGRNIFQVQENCTAVLYIDREHQRINLKTGSIAFVFRKLQKLGSGRGGFSVDTPTAAAGVRGTAFFIKVEDLKNTYICTCNGRLTLRDAVRERRRWVQADLHKAYRYTTVGDEIKSTRVGLLYHDNATMDDLAAMIDYTIRWGTRESPGY
jgi:ferric-dicitrate binding protein FerR (iron transport regulator)